MWKSALAMISDFFIAIDKIFSKAISLRSNAFGPKLCKYKQAKQFGQIGLVQVLNIFRTEYVSWETVFMFLNFICLLN